MTEKKNKFIDLKGANSTMKLGLAKAVPVVGGLIGGGFDFATTKIIAENAYKMFITNSI